MLKPSPGRFFLVFLSEAGAQAARSGLWIKFIRVLKVQIKHEWNVMCILYIYIYYIYICVCGCVICCILSFVAIAIIVVIGTIIRTVMLS